MIHCFWTFDSLDGRAGFLAAAFGDAGAAVGDELKRPRLSYNVAIYHRSRGSWAPEPLTRRACASAGARVAISRTVS